jgi:hypothetical protein
MMGWQSGNAPDSNEGETAKSTTKLELKIRLLEICGPRNLGGGSIPPPIAISATFI